MAEHPPQSILPPPPRISKGAKSALVALIITVPLAIAGVYFAFYIAHAGSFLERALFMVLYWPALLVIAFLGTIEAPGLLVHVSSFAAEFLYVWGIVRLTMAVANAR